MQTTKIMYLWKNRLLSFFFKPAPCLKARR